MPRKKRLSKKWIKKKCLKRCKLDHVGKFGNVYVCPNPREAIKQLLKEKSGEVWAAVVRGELIKKTRHRAYLEIDNGRALVSLDWFGEGKTWVLTAYNQNPVLDSSVK